MRLTKLVNGNAVEMTQDEQTEFNKSRGPDQVRQASPAGVLDALLSALVAKNIFSAQEIAAIQTASKAETKR